MLGKLIFLQTFRAGFIKKYGHSTSLSNSNYFTLAKREFTSVIFKNCLFPNIQLKGVLNRLPPFKNLSDNTNRSLMG